MSMLSELFVRPGGALPSGATVWLGVTTTALTDGATTNPITINGESVTAEVGGIASYSNKEFIWNGSAWQLFGFDAVQSVNGRTGAVQVAELPSVTSSDNKKFLCVVDGAWAKRGIRYIVNLTKAGSTWSSSATPAVIGDNRSYFVYAKLSGADVTDINIFQNCDLHLRLTAFDATSGTEKAIFSGVYFIAQKFLYVTAIVQAAGGDTFVNVYTKTVQMSFDAENSTLSISEA